MFKLENEDVWAVGWSDVHYKTYITTHELSNDGEPAQKKRQRLDGRNYRIEINRPKVLVTYQHRMGWVDRHNRFRQDILGLHVIWKTKRWQTRVQIELFGMALVDAFLVARKFIPKWRHVDDLESSFFCFLRELLPIIADNNEDLAARQVRSKCSQILIGKSWSKKDPKKDKNMQNKDATTIASRARRKKTMPGLSVLAELRTPAVATQKSMSAKPA